jgi:hypothetical protein
MRLLKDVCEKRGRLWALGSTDKYTCLGTQYIEEGGNRSDTEISLKHDGPVRNIRHALLFSTRPFAKPAWTVRSISVSERTALSREPFLQGEIYKHAVSNVGAGKARAIEPYNHKLTMYIIPWRTSSDGIVDDEDFIVALRSKGEHYAFSEMRGTVVGYVDLNGDGIPSIQVSMNCDGACEYVFKVNEKMQMESVISISTH